MRDVERPWDPPAPPRREPTPIPGAEWARRNRAALIGAGVVAAIVAVGVAWWVERPQNDAGSAVDACHDLVRDQVDHVNQWYGTEHEGERDHVEVSGHLYATTDLAMHQEAYYYTCSMTWDGSAWRGVASAG